MPGQNKQGHGPRSWIGLAKRSRGAIYYIPPKPGGYTLGVDEIRAVRLVLMRKRRAAAEVKP